MRTIKDGIFSQANFKYFLFISFCAGLLLSSSSYANDDKTFPGSMCVKYQDLNENEASTGILRVSNSATVSNDSTTNTLRVICPIVKDNVAGADQRIISARVVVIDQHPTEAVVCRVSATFRSNGQNVSDPIGPTRSSANGDPDFLNFGQLNTGTPAQRRHYFIRCNIPPKFAGDASHIVSYSVSEAE